MTPLRFALGWSVAVAIIGVGAEISSWLLARHHPRVRSRFWNLVFLIALCAPLAYFALPRPEIARENGPAIGAFLVVVADVVVQAIDRVPMSSATALLAVWGSIAFVRLVRLARSVRQLANLTRNAKVNPALTGVSPYPVRETPEIATPSASFLGSTILVPPTFANLPDYWRRAVVAHETIHLQNRHGLALLLEEVVLAVFWFHPVMWRLVARVRATREERVDAATVEAVGQPAEYRALLIALATNTRALAPAVSTAGGLRTRLRSLTILEKQMMPNLATARVLCAGMALFGSTAFAYAVAASTTRPPTEQAAETKNQEKKQTASLPEVERKKIFNVNPTFPEASKDKKLSGLVLMELVVTPEGFVKEVTLSDKPHPKKADGALVKAAMDAVRQWRYEPSPNPTRMTVAVDFRPDPKK